MFVLYWVEVKLIKTFKSFPWAWRAQTQYKLVSTSCWHPYQKIHRNIHFPPFFTPRRFLRSHTNPSSETNPLHTCSFSSTVGKYQGTNIKPLKSLPWVERLRRIYPQSINGWWGKVVAAAYVKSYSMCANGICESKSPALLLLFSKMATDGSRRRLSDILREESSVAVNGWRTT